MKDNTPWQLKMFSKSLKKKLKIKELLKFIRKNQINECLLITCGDNNGALNYYIQSAGGKWTWAELEDKNIPVIEALLGEQVIKIDNANHLSQFSDNSFDYIVTIDCHEHMKDPIPFMRELYRITKPDGRVLVTVPNGNEAKVAVRIKNCIGMTKEAYGHFVVGYDIPDIVKMMKKVGLRPCAYSSYSKFFTEMIELCINFLYVKVLSKKGNDRAEGEIAPTSEKQLRKLKKSYKIYSIIYPFCWIMSQLDRLLFFKRGYAVVVESRKE